jgi:hypothetical protein
LLPGEQRHVEVERTGKDHDTIPITVKAWNTDVVTIS